MNEKEFVGLCKKTVAEYANEHLDKTDAKQITEDDVFIVWMCKTLQNSKALAKSLKKVASGMKINSAADDASGFSISERMRVQIRALDQANDNTQNASSLLRVADRKG